MTAAAGQVPTTIRVLLVEDHAIFSEGVRQVISLQTDIEVIGTAADGQEALQIIPDHHPDVVLLDINLPSVNGIQVITRLHTTNPKTKFIVLTAHDDPDHVLHAIRAGASAFCSKDIAPEQLVEIIRTVKDGDYVIHNDVYNEDQIRAWVESKVISLTGPYLVDLDDHYTPPSKREMEILEYVARGYSNQQIALILGISHQTVKNHMTSILKKLDVQDRTQAAVDAIRKGWVRLDDQHEAPDQEKNKHLKNKLSSHSKEDADNR